MWLFIPSESNGVWWEHGAVGVLLGWIVLATAEARPKAREWQGGRWAGEEEGAAVLSRTRPYCVFQIFL